MSRRFFAATHPSSSPGDDRPPRGTCCAVRLTLLGWAQAGFLAALVGALVIFSAEPTPHTAGAPAWVAPTEHPHGVRAVAFAPVGRNLATGGDDGAVVLWQLGQGAARALRKES